MKRKRRRDTKRVRLGKALRAEIAPVLRSYGFRNAPERWDRGLSPTPSDFWVRERGPYTDEIFIQWWKHGGPRFAIHLATDQPGRIPPYSCGLRPFAWRLRGLGFDIWWDWFGGWLCFIGPTVRHAARRLSEVNRYLETGEGSYYLSVYQGSAMWGWWRIPLLRHLAGIRDEDVAELHNPRPGTAATYLDDPQ